MRGEGRGQGVKCGERGEDKGYSEGAVERTRVK